MKLFPESTARWVAVALLIHGFLLSFVGIWLFNEALGYLLHPWDEARWRILVALSGWALAIVCGAAIFILSVARLIGPFQGSVSAKLFRKFKDLFWAEFVLVIIVGYGLIGGGEVVGRIFLGTICFNLFLLGRYAGRSACGG